MSQTHASTVVCQIVTSYTETMHNQERTRESGESVRMGQLFLERPVFKFLVNVIINAHICCVCLALHTQFLMTVYANFNVNSHVCHSVLSWAHVHVKVSASSNSNTWSSKSTGNKWKSSTQPLHIK